MKKIFDMNKKESQIIKLQNRKVKYLKRINSMKV